MLRGSGSGTIPLPEHKGLEGLQAVGPVVLTGVGATCEVLAFNRDGLGLGSLGFGPEVHYIGFFLDHPRALRAYRGDDGRAYALIADNGQRDATLVAPPRRRRDRDHGDRDHAGRARGARPRRAAGPACIDARQARDARYPRPPAGRGPADRRRPRRSGARPASCLR